MNCFISLQKQYFYYAYWTDVVGFKPSKINTSNPSRFSDIYHFSLLFLEKEVKRGICGLNMVIKVNTIEPDKARI